MPRLPRIYIENAIYLITCRGEHNADIFNDEKDYIMFLELLKRYQEEYGIKVFAYTLLPSHVHLLVEIEKGKKDNAGAASKSQQISDFMHDLNNNYTKYFNGRYERKGHLFRERFKAALIEKENYLLKMTAYVHLNAEKLKVVSDAKTYPYSSYQLYLYNNLAEQKDLSCLKKAIDEALGLLGNRDYVNFVEGVSNEEREFIHRKLQRGGILGSEEFIKQVRDEVDSFQAKGEAKKYEIIDNKGYRLFLIFGSLLLVLIIGSGLTYIFFVNREQPKEQAKIPTIDATGKPVESLGRINLKEWKIKLIPIKGGGEALDFLSFINGTFTSEKMNSMGFSNSHYTQTLKDNGAVVWQTMQTGPEGEAVWRGEIYEGKMRGILILRPKEKQTQDFSFVSTE